MYPSNKFIENQELTLADIGSKVTFVPEHAYGNASHKDAEGGRIKSWNFQGVFVDYTRNVALTSFKDLVWG